MGPPTARLARLTDGKRLVVVQRTDLDANDPAAIELALADNRVGEVSLEWDPEILADLQASGANLEGLWSEKELLALLNGGAKPGRTDPDDVPAERATDIKAGDLFELGAHRLLCGDSTAAADVARLFGSAVTPQLMVTDPPYGVEYDPTWRAVAGVNRNLKKMGPVANDDRADWTEAWRHYRGALCYVWHAGLKAPVVAASLESVGFELRSQIVWVKDRMALSRGDYHWQHEPCWYAVRAGHPGLRNDDRTQTTVWNIPAREDSGHGHGTQKPVECMRRAIANHTTPAVYDPFVGSGTTIVAAEQTGRACYAIELTASYVQVAIDRWEAFTGQKAVKAGEAIRA